MLFPHFVAWSNYVIKHISKRVIAWSNHALRNYRFKSCYGVWHPAGKGHHRCLQRPFAATKCGVNVGRTESHDLPVMSYELLLGISPKIVSISIVD